MADQGFQSKTGESFTAESFAVVFREGQIVLDFRRTAPRLDDVGGDKKQTIVSEHQPILMDPRRAKAFKEVLEKNIQDYEERHGEIETPSREEEEPTEPEDSQDYIA